MWAHACDGTPYNGRTELSEADAWAQRAREVREAGGVTATAAAAAGEQVRAKLPSLLCNKAQALRVLTARIQEKDRSERAAKDAAERKSLIGSGDRSDRIRTYNFPQGRFTDHRINLTLYKLLSVMEGDLGDVVEALQAFEAAEQLAALEGTA